MKQIAFISVFNAQEPERSMYELFLYDLLKERKPYQNISHKEMPTYKDHINFIRHNKGKYKEWFIIQELTSKNFVGSIYLGPENNIGIFILDMYNHQGYGKATLNGLYRCFNKISIISANIAPTNSASLAFFISQGFKYAGKTIEYTDGDLDSENIIQYTYAITNPFYVERKTKHPV